MRNAMLPKCDVVRAVHLAHLLQCGVVGVLCCLGIAFAAPGADRGQDRRPPRGGGAGGQSVFLTDVPTHAVDLVLGRPTRDSVTLSVLAYQDAEGYVAYGKRPEQLSWKTPMRLFAKGQPVEVVIAELDPDAQYSYQFVSRNTSTAPFVNGPTHSFHTQRPAGTPFVFTITADSHLDERTAPAVYGQTLANILGDSPDFHVDLGDTFMTEKHADREGAARQYLAQRYYFGSFAHSAPLFLVLGNHDGEGQRWQEGGANSLAAWSNTLRKRYFPNPVADGFYTGNAVADPVAGALQDYFAWTWGDALFVVLDPFWFTPRKRGGDDNWVDTLGTRQYEWLARTLDQSGARYKFVFIHNLVGGADKQSRGGAEAAPYYEWGGKNADGSDGFAQHRPGWAMPIHQLLVRNGVTAVFHGHDHFFAKQELDGVVYQLVPQPATPGARNVARTAEEYGYRSGVILPSPGYLRVAVGEGSAKVTFVGTAVERSGPAGTVVNEYQVSPRGLSKAGRKPGS